MLIEYEVRASWWIVLCLNAWLQKQAAKYFIWKVSRKMKRLPYSSARARVLRKTLYKLN